MAGVPDAEVQTVCVRPIRAKRVKRPSERLLLNPCATTLDLSDLMFKFRWRLETPIRTVATPAVMAT